MIEIIDKRKERERHILNNDGSITAEIYDKDIYYLDNGEYKECDDTIIDNGNMYENKTNRIKSMFSKDEVQYSIMIDDDYIIFKMLGKKPTNVIHKNNTISYKNVLDYIDVDYEIINGNIKESIIINNVDGIKELDNFLFVIDTNMDVQLEGKNIVLSKDGIIKLKMPCPFMIDLNKNVNNNESYIIKNVDDKKILAINIDNNWLMSDKVAYPVILDPTIINAQGENCYDVYLSSENPTTNMDISEKNRVSVYSDHIHRSLIKFILPTIDPSCSIVNASMRLYTYDCDVILYNNPKLVNVHAMNQDWDETTATWNSASSNYDSHIENSFYPSFTFESGVNAESIVDITKLVKQWYSGKPNYGVMLKCNDETYNGNAYSYTSFSKTYDANHQTALRPLLTISYRKQDGIQNYMDYKTINYTQGNSYINTFNGNIINIFDINKTVGSKLPINLQLIHNSSNGIWKYNYEETLTPETIGNLYYLKYIDTTGATLYLLKNSNNEYKDEDGFNYTVKLVNNKYQLTDSIGNIKEFELIDSIYRLKKIIDLSNNQVTITYTNGKITKIVDSSNDELNITYNSNTVSFVSNYDTATVTYLNNNVISVMNKIGTTSFEYNNYNLISKITDVNNTYNTFTYLSSLPHRVNMISNYGLNNTLGRTYTYTYETDVTKITDNKNRISVHLFDATGRLVNKYLLSSSSSSFEDSYGINEQYYNTSDNSNNKLSNSTIPIKYVKNLLINSRLEPNKSCNFTYNGFTIESNYNTLEKELYFDPQQYNTNSIEFTIPSSGDYTISFDYKTCHDIGDVRLYKKVNNVETLLDSGKMLVSSSYDRIGLTGAFDANDILVLKILPSDNHADTYIRRLQVEHGKVSNLYNMIENSNFTDGINYWTVSGEIDGDPWLNPYEVVTLPSGDKAVKLYSNPEGSSSLSQHFNISGKEGDVYHISFWYKSEGIFEAGGEEGNMANLQFISTDPESGGCTHNLPLNYNINEWQFFDGTYVAENDYDDFFFNLISSHECNSVYITDVMLTRDLSQFFYEYDEEGNIIKSSGLNNTSNTFEYDKNNQLIASFDPKGNNFKFEYDNVVTNRVLKGISPTGISNEIKYDSFGNPIKTIINNVNPESQYVMEGNYYIRLKGTNKYLTYTSNNDDMSFNIIQCNIPYISLGFEELYGWYLKFNDKYLGIDQNNQLILMDDSTNRIYFELKENNNASYSIKWIHDNIYLYVDSNNKLNAHIVQMDESNIHKPIDNEMFYFEDIYTNLYIEGKAKYTSDGKFVESVTDVLGKKTIYNINSNTGLINSITNPKNITSNYYYNNNNRLSRIVYNNKQLDYLYNNNKISNIISGNKNYSFNYNNYYDIQSIQLNNNTLVSHTYDSNNGNLMQTTYGNNQSIGYQYDEFDRLHRMAKGLKEYTYEYDNKGNVSKISSTNEKYHFYYDYANRLAKSVGNNIIKSFKYDINNNIVNKHIIFENNEYDINYDYNSDDALIGISADNISMIRTYDYLGRLQETSINNSLATEYKYVTNGNKTSLLLSSMKIGNDEYKYQYDDLYNITKIYINGVLQNEYEYDNFNQLVVDIDYESNTKHKYIYDLEGNILRNLKYDLNDKLLSDNKYEYNNNTWEDQLTSFNNEIITYDAIGNPITFGNKIFTWSNGRELSTYQDVLNNLTVSYDYTIDGIRNKKNVNNVITEYYLDGNLILFEKTGNNVIYYIYDDKKKLLGFKYNENTYYYKKNYQNDIIGIYDGNYIQIVYYKYDSFGNVTDVIDNSGINLSNINNYRYRSYYYDNETGLYYLNSRYYSPIIGRFINSDGVLSTSNKMNICNLYNYTNNNYINCYDDMGYGFFNSVWSGIKTIASAGFELAKEFVKSITIQVGEGTYKDYKDATRLGSFSFNKYSSLAGFDKNVPIIGDAGYGRYQDRTFNIKYGKIYESTDTVEKKGLVTHTYSVEEYEVPDGARKIEYSDSSSISIGIPNGPQLEFATDGVFIGFNADIHIFNIGGSIKIGFTFETEKVS